VTALVSLLPPHLACDAWTRFQLVLRDVRRSVQRPFLHRSFVQATSTSAERARASFGRSGRTWSARTDGRCTCSTRRFTSWWRTFPVVAHGSRETWRRGRGRGGSVPMEQVRVERSQAQHEASPAPHVRRECHRKQVRRAHAAAVELHVRQAEPRRFAATRRTRAHDRCVPVEQGRRRRSQLHARGVGRSLLHAWIVVRHDVAVHDAHHGRVWRARRCETCATTRACRVGSGARGRGTHDKQRNKRQMDVPNR